MATIILDSNEFKIHEGPGSDYWRAYMPTRDLANRIGSTVTYDAVKRQVIFDGKYLFFPFKFDDPVPGHTSVLIRKVCEKLGWQVTWLANSKQIKLEKDNPVQKTVTPAFKPVTPSASSNNGQMVEYWNDYPGYGTFSGGDVEIAVLLPGEAPIVLGEASTISYSALRDVQELRTIGRISVKGITRGGRRVAGSLILTVFDRHTILSMRKTLKGVQSSGPLAKNDMYDRMKTDELPCFDIIINMANEYGNAAYLVIYGVTVFQDGQVISVEDAYSENVWEYIARDIQLLRPIGGVTNIPSTDFFGGILPGGLGFSVGTFLSGSSSTNLSLPESNPLNSFILEMYYPNTGQPCAGMIGTIYAPDFLDSNDRNISFILDVNGRAVIKRSDREVLGNLPASIDIYVWPAALDSKIAPIHTQPDSGAFHTSYVINQESQNIRLAYNSDISVLYSCQRINPSNNINDNTDRNSLNLQVQCNKTDSNGTSKLSNANVTWQISVLDYGIDWTKVSNKALMQNMLDLGVAKVTTDSNNTGIATLDLATHFVYGSIKKWPAGTEIRIMAMIGNDYDSSTGWTLRFK